MADTTSIVPDLKTYNSGDQATVMKNGDIIILISMLIININNAWRERFRYNDTPVVADKAK